MVEPINAVILGTIQGLTEFLPISSSGHLILGHELLDFEVTDSLTFDVALHLGTLTALLVYFWKDVVGLVASFFGTLKRRRITSDHDRLVWQIVVAMVPAIVLGAIFESFFETLRSPWIVITTLLVVGVLFILVERRRYQPQSLPQLSWSKAVAIGLSQAIALIPGVSRSGITIVTGMLAGLSRSEAARFTFLLSIPTVAGAAAKKLYDLRDTPITADERTMMLIGIISAAVVGYAVIRFLMSFLSNHRLTVFAYYRFAIAALAAGILLMR